MRKNIKNDKVIKAITIGLATMVAATSVPVSVLAEEGDAPEEPAVESSSEESSENPSEDTSDSSEAAQTAGDCADIVSNDAPAAAEALTGASEAVAAIEGFVAAEDQGVVTSIATGLEGVSGDIAAIGSQEGDLADASALIGGALVLDMNADASVSTANNELTTAGQQQAAFAEADKKTDDNSQAAVNKAEVANTSNDKSEAYQAKDDAVAALDAAKDGLAAAEEAYGKTSEAVSAAETAYNDAVKEQKAAADKLADAKEALNSASTNATAANERLKAIQSQMDNLNKKVDDLAKQKEDLEKLNEQYYKLMVHFYRDDKIKSAVYKTDGTLDIEKSAEKAMNKNTASANENTFKVGRALMAELIEFKLKAAGVDPTTIHIGEEVAGGTHKTMSEGTLTKDTSGNDRVEIKSESDIWFADYGKGNDGRGNAVKVTYEKDGQQVTEYYNYVLKSKEGEKDLENGPIYLARIDINAKGEDMVSRDTDVNNMDDLSKLNKRIAEAVKAAAILDEYAAAKAEVDEAAKLVDDLTKAIETLNNTDIRISADKVENLGKALKQAKEDLKAASERKEELEGMVEAAQKAVDGIDLSRFNKSLEEDGTESEDAATAVTASAIFEVPAAETGTIALGGSEETGTVAADGTTAADGTETGVLGVRTSAGAAETDDNEQEPAETVIKADVDTEEMDVEEVKGKEESGKIVRIADNKVPLAEMPFEADDNISWWWLLVIALFGAAGKAMYENHKRREEANR